ncbi:MAG: rhodanese-like domain-containing protein [Pseudomonas sp.]|jgi:rhodanese-related sulfurtransferase|uniref:rhodanese-like domain-containing protein n=1 Tax=Stutzerimonas frequens TaxID=2968969 RepID=UPI0007B9ED2E|nr:rhodanese-like domain-containing protein [Stutzerimonas frequens]MAL90563.1 rhodanese-like domain-containing protein [Pseudomonas sp.]MEC7472221.1 rhodanese-like domain-containing protein [Pseudomonadota bacterium]NCT77938.1 rhodanese-like domain-containing protein [Stutzerimonas stutzeri]KZX64586.1 sulfurtransferase [Stutzerimonas frequens]MBA4725686.1 rhodanese-like domain-containing protein [Pseudomonas sp.]|tara:strand:+ start:6829 stop:7272 length:444 start_codon:yes stop_codon:yes gene_type:complete
MRCVLVFLLLMASLGTVHAVEAPDEVDGAMTINVFQAKRLHELGAVFIDVRSDREWLWGHVEGAVHFDLASDFVSLAGTEWPRELPLVIYCDSEICPRSAEAARMAVAWGYQRVFYFRAGYFAWQLHDLPQVTVEDRAAVVLNAQAH